MKKLISLSCLFLLGCSNTVDLNPVANSYQELRIEPKNCEYKYEITSSSSMYNENDAKKYLLNQIVKMDETKAEMNNAYLIIKQSVKENKDAVFGPKQTYSFVAKVYFCKF